ncbi:MAG TPA: protein translocase subunit SecF [Terriglobales bacterium]|nr:protein translocase subunit SecF [Terriglobales bacterium]
MKTSRSKTIDRSAQNTPVVPPKFFALIPANAGIDFVKLSPRMAMLSCGLILLGFVSMFLRGGLNYGIDFMGGTHLDVRFAKPTAVAAVRAALDRPDLSSVSVQEVGAGSYEFQINGRTAGDETGATVAAIKTGLSGRFGAGSYEVVRTESVGPKVGQDLWRDATLSILAATVIMGIYIAARFDFSVGVGAAVKLIHDVLITLGALSLANMEFDLTAVAALLTVVGFSVNDNVIISDRIRESRRLNRRESLPTLINRSINETLSRTVINSGTVVLSTAALFLLGGPVIHSFAFALLVGFVIGTYSSIFVSTPIVLYLEAHKRRAAKP